MKNFLAILILVIGIVLLIPDKTLAADCDLTLSTAATSRYYCEDNDTMTITSDGSTERIWTNIDAGHDSNNGTASTGVTINNAGTLYSRQSNSNGTGRGTVYFDESTNGTLINSGTISADSHRAVSAGIDDDTTNFTLINSGTIQASCWAAPDKLAGTSQVCSSGEGIHGVYVKGSGATITNETDGIIKADDYILSVSASNSTITNKGQIISDATSGNEEQYGVNFSEGSTGTNIYNHGTIRTGYRTIRIVNSNNDDITLTNYSGGTITSYYKESISVASGVDGFTINNNEGATIQTTGTDAGNGIVMDGNTNATVVNDGTITSDINALRCLNCVDVTFTNTGTIESTDSDSGTATIIRGATGTNTIINSGDITSGNDRAVDVSQTSGTTVTNSGTITAGTNTGLNLAHTTNAVVTNSGTITADDQAVSLENEASASAGSGTSLTNSGTIQVTGSGTTKYAIKVGTSGKLYNDATITNTGTIASSTGGDSIHILASTTGTNIVLDEAPSFTGEVELNDTATTITLSCGMTQSLDLEVHSKTGMTVTNNLCGNDTYEILDSSKNADGDNSEDDGYVRIDEGLEVLSNNATYRSENISTKLKGLFNAANYIDGVEPEDKFFRVFYSSVKRENMYKGSMSGVVGQLSPINWGNVTSNIFLGYSKHTGDFDNGEFLGGDNYALGLKNVFTKNGLKVSFSPMIGLNDLDITDYDSDSTAKVKTNLLSEFLAFNGKIDKEIKTGEDSSLNLSFQSTLGLQRFPDYLSSFSDGDLSVDEAIEQVLSGGFEVKYNEELGKGFIIKPYVGVTINHNLNGNIDIVKDDDSLPASPADSMTSGYYAGLTFNKKTKYINFDLDLMYGNEDGLINQIAAISLTKTFGKAKVKTAKLEEKSDTSKTDISSANQDYNQDLKELEELRKANETIKAQNEALKAQNDKLKLLAQKTLEENQASKKLIVELLKENEKIKFEKQMMTNHILESENKELLEKLEGSNVENKPSKRFLIIFAIIFAIIFILIVIGLTSIVAFIYNKIMYRLART